MKSTHVVLSHAGAVADYRATAIAEIEDLMRTDRAAYQKDEPLQEAYRALLDDKHGFVTSKSFTIRGAALRALEGEGFDFVEHGFARVWNGYGTVTDWIRPRNPDIGLARLHDRHYRRLPGTLIHGNVSVGLGPDGKHQIVARSFTVTRKGCFPEHIYFAPSVEAPELKIGGAVFGSREYWRRMDAEAMRHCAEFDAGTPPNLPPWRGHGKQLLSINAVRHQ